MRRLPDPRIEWEDSSATVSTAAATAKPTPPFIWSSSAECAPTNEPEPTSRAGPWRGLSKREVMRCLKRYVAREIYRVLTAPSSA